MLELSIAWRVHDFDLSLDATSAARNVALFGPSGSGKTTTLLAIAGLRRPDRGRIVLDGRVLFDSTAGIDVPASERGLGVVFQEGRLFPHLRVRDNLAYGRRARNGGGHAIDLDAAVALLGLGDLLDRWPASLSGGEARRVAIGRALLCRPRALLLDEPLVGLHREARAQVLEYLVRLNAELAIPTLLVSHQPEEVAALAQEVVLLDDGAVQRQMTIAEFATLR